MKFRPCIDIHNGKVKQLVGGTLKDEGNTAVENFISEKTAADYAKMYKKDQLTGGHIILLNAKESEYFEKTKKQAFEALAAYPDGMQVGGGITDENAGFYIEAGASHVIVTSFVFSNGEINYDNLNKLVAAVGKEKLVLDLSCRKKEDKYYIVTERWQNFSDEELNVDLIKKLSAYCDEFLIHGVDSEGKGSGMEAELVKILADAITSDEGTSIKITYAGGIASLEDIEKFKRLSEEKIDFTIGSALDIFGGNLKYDDVKHIK